MTTEHDPPKTSRIVLLVDGKVLYTAEEHLYRRAPTSPRSYLDVGPILQRMESIL